MNNLIYYSPDLVMVIHLLSTAIMVGVIWVSQLLHYPSFHFIEKDKYIKFQHFHMNRISIIVMPAMIIEILSGFLLLKPSFNSNIFFIISVFILIVIWVTTFLFFTKIHQDLSNGYNRLTVNKLVMINWVRTILWSSRLIILLFINI